MEFRVLTLNCWGILIISKDRIRRMNAIADLLANCQYDVVCLQEVWLTSDFELIRDKVSGILPHSHYFHSGVTGSGICILSRYPMEEIFFHQWPINGYIHKIHHADWFGGKGVGLCRLSVKNYTINVYSAHLHAEYNRDSDEYQAHRVLQAFDTAQFINITSGGADLIILAGDLNTEPGDLAYKIIRAVSGLSDAFTHSKTKCLTKIATNECLTNSYTPSALVKAKIHGKRIDYVMYHSGDGIQVDLKTYELPLPDLVPGCSYSYSDHEAVAATLILSKRDENEERFDFEVKREVLEESVQICETAFKNLRQSRIVYWFFTLVLFVLLVTTLLTNPPYGFNLLYDILKVCTGLIMFYTFMMATLWNNIESHAILAGKLGMELSLSNILNKT